MTFTSIAYTHDTSREQLIARFRDRIATGDRTKLSKDERGELILHFIDRLGNCKTEDAVKALCDAEIALLEEGYPVASIANQYLPDYRKAITLAVEDGRLPKLELPPSQYGKVYPHWGLYHLTYPNEVQQAIKQKTTIKNNLKQDDLQPIRADRFLNKAKDLLAGETPYEWAVGLLAVTGRRFSEIVAKGEFKPIHHPYAISFRGQLKKGIQDIEQAQTFLIATLIDADKVLKAINRFRAHPRIQELAELSPDDINSRLNTSVRHYIKSSFEDSEVLPVLPGEKAVTAHNLRGAYAEIATHFFCPPHQGIHRFLQQHLGHVIGESELAKRKNAGATEHYFHYRLVGAQQQLLGEKGILLERFGALPTTVEFEREPVESEEPKFAAIEPVEVMENESMAIAQLETEIHTRKSRASVPTHLMHQLKELAATKLKAQGSNADVMLAIIKFLRDDSTPSIATSIESFGSTFQWFTAEVERLRAENQALSAKLDQAQGQLQRLASVAIQPLEALKSENERLKAELIQFQQLKQLFTGSAPPVAPITPPTEVPALPVQPRVQPTAVGHTPQKRIRDEGTALEKIDEAISLIIAWNDDPIRTFNDKWFIGVPALLGVLRGNDYSASQGRVQQALANRRPEIDSHHQQHNLGQRHNVRHNHPISQNITL